MNSDTLARICKFKTSDGAFVWQPGMVEGQAAALLGYPVIEAEDMPAFGIFRARQLSPTAARRGSCAIRNKPFLHFCATKRVGGAIIDSNAIKLLKFAAS